LLRLITPLFEDESPLVRAMAIWSAKRLMREEEFAPFKSRYEAREADPEVAREWAEPLEGHSA
jgi:epoxyqueuosine reductase